MDFIVCDFRLNFLFILPFFIIIVIIHKIILSVQIIICIDFIVTNLIKIILKKDIKLTKKSENILIDLIFFNAKCYSIILIYKFLFLKKISLNELKSFSINFLFIFS